MMNIFSSQKKKYTPANMSVAPKPLNSPMSQMGSQSTSLFNKPKPAPTPQFQKNMSVAPKPVMSQAPKAIQGSGMSGSYASNPSNFKPATPAVPTVTQKKQPSPQIQTIDNFLNRQQQVAEQKKGLAADMYGAGNEMREGMYNLQQKQLGGMKGDATEAFNQFEQGTLAGLDRVRASGERNKDNAEDYYGDAQRTAAMARRETQGEAQRRFSNLNTIDSFGEGSFKQANENIDSDFNRLTQQFAKEKANKLAEIDDQVFGAEQTAEQAIQEQRISLQQVLRQIDTQLQAGTMEHKFAQEQAMAEYEDSVLGIEDWFNNIQLTSDQQKTALQLELDSMSSFSPEFMATGVPSNQKEYEFLIANQDQFSKLYPELFGEGDGQAKQQIVGLIDELMGSGLGPVTGKMQVRGLIPGTSAQLTKNKINQLQSLLSLDNITKLKGTGAISDREFATLTQAASALGRNLSETDFVGVLSQMKQNLGGSPNVANSSVNMSQFVR